MTSSLDLLNVFQCKQMTSFINPPFLCLLKSPKLVAFKIYISRNVLTKVREICWRRRWKFHTDLREFVYLEVERAILCISCKKKITKLKIPAILKSVKITRNVSSSFQAISNKHNCCNSNNNNCIKICDNQIVQPGKEKEKEGLVKDEEESYNKFRQLLDYEDVSQDRARDIEVTDKLLTFSFHFRLQIISSSIHSFAKDIVRCCLQSSAGNRYFGGRTKR